MVLISYCYLAANAYFWHGYCHFYLKIFFRVNIKPFATNFGSVLCQFFALFKFPNLRSGPSFFSPLGKLAERAVYFANVFPAFF